MKHEHLQEQESELLLTAKDAEQLADEHEHGIAESRTQLWSVKELLRFDPNESPDDTVKRANNTTAFYAERGVACTPLLEHRLRGGGAAYFKDERQQPIGSFKIRGAFWASMQALKVNPHLSGTAQASAGNAGQGGAEFALFNNADSAHKIESHVFLAHTASDVKVKALLARGATVHTHDPITRERYETLHDAKAGAARYSAASELGGMRGVALLEPYAHPDTIAGQGTIVPEVYAQLRAQGVDLVTRPLRIRCGAGGLGLTLGMAEALDVLAEAGLVHPDSYIEATQEEYTDAAIRAVEQLQMHGAVDLGELFADGEFNADNDGTAVQYPDKHNVALASRYVSHGRLVLRRASQTQVALAMQTRPAKRDLEPAGALGYASHLYDTQKAGVYLGLVEDEYTDVVVLSGGNVSDYTKDVYAATLEDRRTYVSRAGASAVTRTLVEVARDKPDPSIRKHFLRDLGRSGIHLLE